MNSNRTICGFHWICAGCVALTAGGRAAEFSITQVIRGPGGEVTVEVPAQIDHYYILLRGDSVANVDQPVAIRSGR